MERLQHATKHGQTDHMHSTSGHASKAREARGYLWIRPHGNGLLVESLVVSTALNRLGFALARMVGEEVECNWDHGREVHRRSPKENNLVDESMRIKIPLNEGFSNSKHHEKLNLKR